MYYFLLDHHFGFKFASLVLIYLKIGFWVNSIELLYCIFDVECNLSFCILKVIFSITHLYFSFQIVFAS
jgi:hypothetical protein